jgi:hypothetical protein
MKKLLEKIKNFCSGVLPPRIKCVHDFQKIPDSTLYVKCSKCGEEAVYFGDQPQ